MRPATHRLWVLLGVLSASAVACGGVDGSSGSWAHGDNSSPADADDAGSVREGGGTSSHDAGGATTHDAAGGGSSDANTSNSGNAPQFLQKNLDVINNYRAGGGLPPYVLDDTLTAFAYAGSQELSQDHTPHQHFMTASANGTCPAASENQGDWNGVPMLTSDPTANEMEQIEFQVSGMYNEGPGPYPAHGHYLNIMSSQWTRLGAGLFEVDDVLYLTNDFR